MKQLKFGKTTLDMYDSIDDMPIGVFQEYNRNIMIDSGIGSDLSSLMRHQSDIISFINNDDPDNAKKSLNNYIENIRFVVSGISPKNIAFYSLVKKINGKDIDRSVSIDDFVDHMTREGLSIGDVNEFLDYVKKKSKRK